MKERLDVLLVERELAASREKAKAFIMSGIVYVDGQKEDKPGQCFSTEAKIEVRGKTLEFVSRGGLKLKKALQVFPIELEGRICLDIGASTGGFTDCCLQNGASKVYSVDVGHGQLDWKLRNDARVICMEKTNFRYCETDDFPELMDFACCDVSFISLKKIMPPAFKLLKDNCEFLCLIKPQFEAGKEKVGKKGVVRNPKIHEDVIMEICSFAEACGFSVKGLDYSPIKGPEGNIEYLLYLQKISDENYFPVWKDTFKEVVKLAHGELNHE